MTPSQLVPALLVPLIAWRIYRRVRRNIGRQLYRPRKLLGAAIFFTVIAGLIALGAAANPQVLGGLGAGLLIALPLGVVALRLTKWENSTAGEFYTPNTTIGLAVTLLFLGRIVYRVVSFLGPIDADAPPPPLSAFQNPLTLLVFGITAGFYITYYIGLYLRGRSELDAARAK
jgi:hypothetical protein